MTRTWVLIFVATALLAVTGLAPQFAVAGGIGGLSERDTAAAGEAIIASKNAKF